MTERKATTIHDMANLVERLLREGYDDATIADLIGTAMLFQREKVGTARNRHVCDAFRNTPSVH